MLKYSLLGAATAVLLSATVPAHAQKSADTMRIAINNPFAVLSSFDLPLDEASIFSREIYDYMVAFDEYNKKFVPILAKSWKQIDDKTIEVELRDDIKFHNGDPLEASDVKSTVDYITDSKSKITYQSHYTWMQSIEVLGPHTFRIHETEPTATAYEILAYRVQIYDGKLLDKMQDKADYGRLNPVGTGPYKVSYVDTNRGVMVERYDPYNVVPQYKKAQVKRVQGIPMPDKQTQAAQLIVGGVDLLRAVPPDQAKALTANPNIGLTYVPSPNLIYLALDSMNVGGNKALSDQRVRKAIFMGIDREEIIKYIVPGGEVAEHVQADCFKATIACKYSVLPPKYDPEAAKKLLAEAGYADGFDLNYVVFAPYRDIAEAIAGQLRKIGVRMTVQPADIALYRRMQNDGKLQAWTSMFPTGSYPDSSNVFSVLFTGPAARYFNDDLIAEVTKTGDLEADPEKRADLYAKGYNRVNEMNYNLPITSVPTVYVHGKDVKISPNKLSAGENAVGDYGWR